MKKKIFRIFICLLVVCCLLVRISPIQAKAATLTGTVAVGTAITAGLVALGIGVGATETAFNNLVDSLTTVAGSDRVPVWISETADGFVTYLQESFLGSLLAHCFDIGVLSSDSPYSSSTSFVWENSTYNVSGNNPFYLCVIKYPGITRSLYGFSPLYFTGTVYKDGVIQYNKSSGSSPLSSGLYAASLSGTLFYGIDWATISLPQYTFDSYEAFDNFVPISGVSSSQDLTLGSVGATMSSSNYDPWRTAAIPVVPPAVGGGTADEEDALPVTFPGLDTPSITGQTQAGAQSGITPGTVVEDILSGGEVVPETGTIADVIAAIKAIPASIADFFADVVAAVKAIPAAIADVFTPSGTVEAYSLDLKRFFPFCIPYDIYSMLAALAADPVAPKFDFEIDLGPVGILPISVDFSEWDDVAALLRTCEAAIFAVGLAVKTKELIGW